MTSNDYKLKLFLPLDLGENRTFLIQKALTCKRQRGALAAVCTPTLKSVLGQRNTKSVY